MQGRQGSCRHHQVNLAHGSNGEPAALLLLQSQIYVLLSHLKSPRLGMLKLRELTLSGNRLTAQLPGKWAEFNQLQVCSKLSGCSERTNTVLHVLYCMAVTASQQS